jgi:DNA-binding MarR family transcriptional regulator
MKSKPLAFEKFKEDWQRQVMADPTLSPVTFRVSIAISWHMNRKQSGLAWPGMARLAQMVRTTPRTVIRATKQLEAKGHLRIIRSRQRERRGLNRYMPLMKSACHRRDADNADISVLSLGSDQALSLGSDQALSHEPLNKPLREPLSYMDIASATSSQKDSREIEDKRVGEGKRGSHHSATHHNSPLAECYRKARQWFGERGAAVIAKADRLDCVPLDEIADALEGAGDVQELAYSLWRP